MRTPLLRKPHPETPHAEKIYRYNEQTDSTISLTEIRITKPEENGRRRTVRKEIHQGVYPKNSVQLPDTMTVGKLYRCVHKKKTLSLIVYKARKDKKKYSRIAILQALGCIGIFLSGLCFTIMMTHNFKKHETMKDIVISSVVFFTLGVICFAIGKTMEHRKHTKEREIIGSIETLGTDVGL